MVRKLFEYKFDEDGIIGGNKIGNVLLTALVDICGNDYEKAIEAMCEMFDVRGRVIPVTLEDVTLAARFEDGTVVIGEKNIRPGLFSLLVLVGANPGIAQIELGTHLGIDKASIVALLDRLEKAGMLDRLRCTRDRRRQGIYLTSRGTEALESLVAAVRTLERRVASKFTRPEFDLLLSFLRRLYD